MKKIILTISYAVDIKNKKKNISESSKLSKNEKIQTAVKKRKSNLKG